MTEVSQQHEDRMLTWSIGLMGAGLFAAPSLLATPAGVANAHMAFAAPWAAGVPLALLGRVVGGWHRDADAFHFAGKWGGLQALLVKPDISLADLGRETLSNDEDDQLKVWKIRTTRLNRWAVGLYYASVGAFGAGIALIWWGVSLC
jgi:hypothetical protein